MNNNSGRNYKYAVAISFLSRDRDLARRLKIELESALGERVFTYLDFQPELTGKSLEDALYPVFEIDSRIVLVLYRPSWGLSGGTLVEYRAVQHRRLRSDERFLYPIIVEQGSGAPPWSEDVIYHDLRQYSLEAAVSAVVRMVRDHKTAEGIKAESPDLNSTPLSQSAQPLDWKNPLRQWLTEDFITNGVFTGHFGAKGGATEAKRWQSKGGEAVGGQTFPKYPYYLTYWGYRAALHIAPDHVGGWRPLTLNAVATHFRSGRWLKVELQVPYSAGPTAKPRIAETVRHTARAAELLHLLQGDRRKISEIAWELINEAPSLQCGDGGWVEFRSSSQRESSLWASVYVYRLLSVLAHPSVRNLPDERDEFLEVTKVILEATESYLIRHWQTRRWAPGNDLTWQEGASGVLPEVGPFLRSEQTLSDCYDALRSLLTPAGRLREPSTTADAPAESVQALRLAFALQSAGAGLSERDPRFNRLVEWLQTHLDLDAFNTCDVAFAVAVLRIESPTTGTDLMKV